MVFRRLLSHSLCSSGLCTTATIEDEILLTIESLEELAPYDLDTIACPAPTSLYSPSLLTNGAFYDEQLCCPEEDRNASGRSGRSKLSEARKNKSNEYSRGNSWSKLVNDRQDGIDGRRKRQHIPGMDFIKRKAGAARRSILRSTKQPSLQSLAHSTTVKAASAIFRLLGQRSNGKGDSDREDVTKAAGGSVEDEIYLPVDERDTQVQATEDASRSGSQADRNGYNDEEDKVPFLHCQPPISSNEQNKQDEGAPTHAEADTETKHEANSRFFLNPPVFEVTHRKRRSYSDASAGDLSTCFSDVSSLSGTNQPPLEFSLETGFGSKSLEFLALSESILRSIERVEKRASAETTKCLVLLMNPSRKIFEIIETPYNSESTTVGEILDRIPSLATDKRIGKMKFTGLSHEGVFVSAPMVPVEILIKAQTLGKPLFAVPHGYSSEQISTLGNSLLQTPQVAQLLKEQLAKVELANAKQQPQVLQHPDMTTRSAAPAPRVVIPTAFTNVQGRQIKSID